MLRRTRICGLQGRRRPEPRDLRRCCRVTLSPWLDRSWGARSGGDRAGRDNGSAEAAGQVGGRRRWMPVSRASRGGGSQALRRCWWRDRRRGGLTPIAGRWIRRCRRVEETSPRRCPSVSGNGGQQPWVGALAPKTGVPRVAVLAPEARPRGGEDPVAPPAGEENWRRQRLAGAGRRCAQKLFPKIHHDATWWLENSR